MKNLVKNLIKGCFKKGPVAPPSAETWPEKEPEPAKKEYVSTLKVYTIDGKSIQWKTLEWFPEWKESAILPWKPFVQWYWKSFSGKTNRPYVFNFKNGQTVFRFKDIVHYSCLIEEKKDND